MGFYSGWGGRVVVSTEGVDKALPVGRWQVSFTCELVDRTVATSGDFREYLTGYKDIEATVDCFWESALNVMREAPLIVPATFLKLYLYIDKNSLKGWRLHNFVISSVVMDDEVRGVVKYTFTGKQSGQNFSTPSTLTTF